MRGAFDHMVPLVHLEGGEDYILEVGYGSFKATEEIFYQLDKQIYNLFFCN